MSDNFYFSPKLQALLRGAKGKFIYVLMFKWYLLIAIPAFWAAYNFFDKLEATGIPAKTYEFICTKLDTAVRITRDCTPHIVNLRDYYRCIDHTNDIIDRDRCKYKKTNNNCEGNNCNYSNEY